jgi:antitoxin component YwqK of YwqJK toxin-antitoxin module
MGEIKLRNETDGSCIQGTGYFLPHNFSCNSKIISYYQNGKIKKIEFFGTEDFKQGKKFIGFFENGQIKFEGIYGGSISYYDMEGKLVGNPFFNNETTYWVDNSCEDCPSDKTRIEIPFFMGQN